MSDKLVQGASGMLYPVVHMPRTLNQCIAALEAENQQLRDIGKRLAADCDAWEKRVERTEAEVERLRVALTAIHARTSHLLKGGRIVVPAALWIFDTVNAALEPTP